jgi:hypothetical protein
MAELDQMRAPGRHDVRSPRPLDDAQRLAEELGAEIVLPEDAVRSLDALAAVFADDLGDRLRWLAGDLERAERILARAEARALDTFEELASTATGLAIHPQALRDASDAVRGARAAHERAERDLEALEPEADGTPDEPAVAETLKRHVVNADERATAEELAHAAARTRAIGVVIAGVGLALLIVATHIIPIFFAIPLPVLAVFYGSQQFKSARQQQEGSQEASENLAMVGAMTDQLYGGRLPASAIAIQTAHERRRHLLELERDTALERLRVAERHWIELAGAEADPADIDAILVRRDPQRHRAAPWVQEAAAVRTALSFHSTARDGWRAAWTGIGRDAPSTADVEGVLAALDADVSAAVATQRSLVVVAPPPEADASLDAVATKLAVVVVCHDPDAE